MNNKIWGLLLGILLLNPVISQAATLQEIRAQHEIDLQNMQKQQQIANFKQQRDAMLAQYKMTMRDRDQANKRIKIAQSDYKNSIAQLNKAKIQESEISAKIENFKQASGQMDKAQYVSQMQKLKSTQNEIYANLKTFQQIQDKSLQDLQALESQYRSLEVTGQQIRQRIEAAQRQLQFVLSQP